MINLLTGYRNKQTKNQLTIHTLKEFFNTLQY